MAQPLPHVLGALGSCGTERLMCVREDEAAQPSCPAHPQLLSHHLMDVAGSHVPQEEPGLGNVPDYSEVFPWTAFGPLLVPIPC